MIQRSFFIVVLFFAICLSTIGLAAQDKPNIVVILADDFGVGDIQAHYPDNQIKTPYLVLLDRKRSSHGESNRQIQIHSRRWTHRDAERL